MSAIPLVINKTMKYGDWMFERELEAIDRATLSAYDRRERIEREVSFDDLLEECVEMTGPQKEAFMEALARGSNADVHTLFCLLDQVKEAIVKRRLAGGE
jgi:uncharacterized protein CbrC (UPF0167 family)